MGKYQLFLYFIAKGLSLAINSANKLSINKIENIINEYFARLFLQNIENFLDKEKLAALFFPATIISLIL